MAIASSCSKRSGPTSRGYESMAVMVLRFLPSSHRRSNPQLQGSAEQRCCSVLAALRAPASPELQR